MDDNSQTNNTVVTVNKVLKQFFSFYWKIQRTFISNDPYSTFYYVCLHVLNRAI